jgi:hypothetical protein
VIDYTVSHSFKIVGRRVLINPSSLAVSITDNASVMVGGTDEPAALGNLYSIGAIAMESNEKLHPM